MGAPQFEQFTCRTRVRSSAISRPLSERTKLRARRKWKKVMKRPCPRAHRKVLELRVALLVRDQRQLEVAPRALQAVPEAAPTLAAAFVDKGEERERALGGQLEALALVEPDALAGGTDVDGEFPVEACDRQRFERLAAVGAGGVGHPAIIGNCRHGRASGRRRRPPGPGRWRLRARPAGHTSAPAPLQGRRTTEVAHRGRRGMTSTVTSPSPCDARPSWHRLLACRACAASLLPSPSWFSRSVARRRFAARPRPPPRRLRLPACRPIDCAGSTPSSSATSPTGGSPERSPWWPATAASCTSRCTASRTSSATCPWPPIPCSASRRCPRRSRRSPR